MKLCSLLALTSHRKLATLPLATSRQPLGSIRASSNVGGCQLPAGSVPAEVSRRLKQVMVRVVPVASSGPGIAAKSSLKNELGWALHTLDQRGQGGSSRSNVI